MRLLFNWLVYAASMLIAAYILPGVSVDSLATAFILAAVLGAINLILRPIFIILTLPATILTLGLFVFVVNGALVLLAASIVPGFAVASLWWAIIFAIVVAVIHGFLHMLSE